MASSYSNLKFELIATGEQSGSWGTTTNTNVGTALEEAIAESVDVSFSSGTVTLTLTDSNATQSARHLRLNLTGTSGGAQNLVVPAIEKPYIVNNGTADTITIKTPSGTGIAVPTGKTMWVYNDGTNVVDAVTHVTTLTAGAATFSGVVDADAGVTVDNITIDGTEIDLSSGDLTLDVAADIILDAGGEEVIFKDGSTNVGHVSMDSDNLTIKSLVSDKDVLIQGNDGGSAITALTLDMSAAGDATFNSGITVPGTFALTGDLTLDGASGTSSTQVMTSAGSGATPTWASPFQSGMILLWSGSTGSIPTGWVICNGSNSTPDLRDRFVVGAGSTYSVDATGGSATITPAGTNAGTALTEAQMPKHYHLMLGPNNVTSPQGSGSVSGVYGGGSPDDNTQAYGTYSTGGSAASGSQTTGTSNGDTHTHTFSGSSHTNLPPYYSLAYIMKT